MKNKNILVSALVVIVVALGFWYMSIHKKVETSATVTETGTQDTVQQTTTGNKSPTGRVASPTTKPTTPTPVGKLKVANFSGKLTEVNTGCFADGECYVIVDGKHITVATGWSRETVGKVLGVPSIAELESHIGETIEAYVKDTGFNTYSLYGNEGFYIKLK